MLQAQFFLFVREANLVTINLEYSFFSGFRFVVDSYSTNNGTDKENSNIFSSMIDNNLNDAPSVDLKAVRITFSCCLSRKKYVKSHLSLSSKILVILNTKFRIQPTPIKPFCVAFIIKVAKLYI